MGAGLPLMVTNQIHTFYVDEIGNARSGVRFAATELSDGVWGFYVPKV